MLTPEQSRAARGWLNWSQEDLAKRANVALVTVRNFERGRGGSCVYDVEAIRTALEMAGVTMAFGGDGEATGITATPKVPAAGWRRA